LKNDESGLVTNSASGYSLTAGNINGVYSTAGYDNVTTDVCGSADIHVNRLMTAIMK